MNTVEIYNRAKNPPTEEEQIRKQNLEIKKSLVKSEEESKRFEWNELPFTKDFFMSIKAIANLLDNEVRELSSNEEFFKKVGIKKSLESKILRKVIEYAKSGQYTAE